MTKLEVVTGPSNTRQLSSDHGLLVASAEGGGARGSAEAQQRLMLHSPVDVRSASMALIALILSLFALQWAKEIVVPILCGVMMSYSLTPIVNRLARWKMPRAVSATVLLGTILAVAGLGAVALGDQTDALIDTVPTVAAKVREMTQRAGEKTSTIERVRRAAAELAAAAAAPTPAATAVAPAAKEARSAAGGLASSARLSGPQPAPAKAAIDPSSIDLRGYLLTGTIGVLAFLGKIAIIFFVALFLMASGNNFRRKMVKLAGPRLSQKKVTIETLDEITEQIQRYLLVQVAVSVVVGVCTWLALFLAWVSTTLGYGGWSRG